MKKLFILFAAMLCLSLGANAAPATVTKAHAASHQIKMLNIDGGSVGTCSATAIGPNAILTAAHCNAISTVIEIDGKDAEIMGTMGDGLDHQIILERGVTFKDYADVDSKNLAQADDVFVFGNPAGIPDIYRKGYVAGFKHKADAPEVPIAILMRPRAKDGNESVVITFYDFNGFFGDSGSGIFDTEGKVVAVTSFIYGEDVNGFSLKFMGSYELRFTPEQLKAAREYAPPVKPEAPVEKKHKSFFDLFSNF